MKGENFGKEFSKHIVYINQDQEPHQIVEKIYDMKLIEDKKVLALIEKQEQFVNKVKPFMQVFEFEMTTSYPEEALTMVFDYSVKDWTSMLSGFRNNVVIDEMNDQFYFPDDNEADWWIAMPLKNEVQNKVDRVQINKDIINNAVGTNTLYLEG